ncbi:hypothetical protein G7Y89_g12222 [Cudoniella acicularis]|uniref:Short-chain dehydrogenase n=1 Tax=Cudoniella acicularis TaxID=354080 RepID=A0A8H4RD01_9HELO|nr:hypothetical protein G7Y89_g12222 [Cudoniella acicularis]
MPHVSAISAFFPPAPTFTDKDLPSLISKVYIVTGAASGVGYETAKILYSAGATVYIGARSASRCKGAIVKIEAETSALDASKKGRLESLIVDLADLATVKVGAGEFLARETRLDGLIHNAGVMEPPAGSKDKFGRDLEMSTNCLGPYLLTLLLKPVLVNTASSPKTTPFSVRVVFVTSMLQRSIPTGGMNFQSDGTPKILSGFMANYMQTKVGCAWLSMKFAQRLGEKKILSLSLHPGLMKTELQRDSPPPMRLIMSVVCKPPVYGAYSEIYAAFSPEVTAEHNGGYLMAWGRIAEVPEEIVKQQGPGGNGAKFYEYCDREVQQYVN